MLKRNPLDLYALARLSANLGYNVTLVRKLGCTQYAEAEPLLHELCHAAIFRIPIHPITTLAARVDQRFRRYVRKRASDSSECLALTVEATVIRMLKWRLNFNVVISEAVSDMYVLKTTEAIQACMRRKAKSKTRRLAKKVIRNLTSLAAMLKDELGIPLQQSLSIRVTRKPKTVTREPLLGLTTGSVGWDGSNHLTLTKTSPKPV